EPQAKSPFKFLVETRGRGEHRVELLADSADGIQVVANFPVYAGVPPLHEVTVAAASGGPALGPDEMAARLLELMNEERVRAQRKPLAQDGRLAAIGLAHSQDMQRHDFIAHTSPSTGTAVDRVARAGVRTPVVLENIGRGYSAEEIHRGLIESPGHRENILNRDATHVGIGVVVTEEDQQAAYLVTEVFARFTHKTDLKEATSQLLSGISSEREKRGQKSLQHDGALSQRCERAAASFFQSPLPTKEQVIERLNREAAQAQPRYSQLMAAAVVIGGIDEAIQLEPWFDPKARALAIGLAQGTRADTFENAIILVALIAY
ncbi:MAG TPA: CAP domain-containing protein, partial [Polyangiales bacterium]|nr:CAP domain-containing protein [Polyangiales bacterium]